MKKRLEAELISIAHRILKLKNKAEVDQLYKETQKLYETLTVLKFYQDNFESVKSDVTQDELEEKLAHSNQVVETQESTEEVAESVNESIAEEEPIVEIEEELHEIDTLEEESTELVLESDLKEETDDDIEEATEEAAIEENEEIVEEVTPVFTPLFELEIEEEEITEPAETATEFTPEDKPVALEDFLGENYTDPVFVKPNEVTLFPSDSSVSEQQALSKDIEEDETIDESAEKEELNSTVASSLSASSIAIGLNDRIGFVQHLFNDSNEDFNRVISQLNSFDTFEEAKNFINEMVIPDYGYWVGEEDYMERFMAIVEKKFQ
jgi:hypothetical protein